jgi:ATP-dependent RNA helicase RhlE
LENFKSGKARVLIATDIVARGIDIVELSHVVNFNIPESPEDYVHRIGRTGRAGLNGTAVSFCDNLEKRSLADIEKLIGKTIPVIAEHPYPLVGTSESEQVKATGKTPARKKVVQYKTSNKGSRPSSRPYRFN